MQLRLQFNSLQQSTFDVLLPHKDDWRDGDISTPWHFASPSLFERAFRELLFCKSMEVIIGVEVVQSQPFLSLPAVRECTSLIISETPSRLAVAEVLEWLDAGTRSNEPKCLVTRSDKLAGGVNDLIQQMKTVNI